MIYDTKQVQQTILYHLKAIDEYVKFIDFSRCHQRAYAERFKAQLTKSEKITSYVLKNLEKIIPKVKEEQKGAFQKSRLHEHIRKLNMLLVLCLSSACASRSMGTGNTALLVPTALPGNAFRRALPGYPRGLIL